MTADGTADLQPRRIRGLGHWRAVRQMLRDYAPGVDSLMDMMRTMPFPLGPIARHVAAPIYFAREQGWMLRGPHGEMAAIMYLRDERRDGVGVIHVDDINVRAEFRGQGLAQRLLALADDIARRKGYRFVKLAVEARNVPAVTLYRKLGYQEQHHRRFTADAAALAARVLTPQPPGVHRHAPTAGRGGAAGVVEARTRRLTRAGTIELSRRIFRAELEVETPATAPVMLAYEAPRVPRRPLWMEAIVDNRTDVGYWEAHREKQGIAVTLGLLPTFWASDIERDVLRLLAERAGRYEGSPLTLRLMSGGHHRALADGAPSLADAFGLTEMRGERMLMVLAETG